MTDDVNATRDTETGTWPEWIARAVRAEQAGGGRPSRSALLGTIQDMAYAGRFDEIAQGLDTVRCGDVSDLMMVTLVRGSFPFRLAMPESWWNIRDRMAEHVAAVGYDVDGAMYGLMEQRPDSHVAPTP